MADEPTGALDSSTGKQVFDTLKKLSENKLVIVVSHDRDFAEQYGDRIVELKDGKIISDVSKARAESAALSANLTVSGDTLCVKSGAALSDTDFEAVKAFLTRTEGSVVISGDQREISLFKQVSRLQDDGSKEVFRPTDEKQTPKKEYSPDDSRFIRSKLPARHAVKIGISGMKSKPLRLVLHHTPLYGFLRHVRTPFHHDGLRRRSDDEEQSPQFRLHDDERFKEISDDRRKRRRRKFLFLEPRPRNALYARRSRSIQGTVSRSYARNPLAEFFP